MTLIEGMTEVEKSFWANRDKLKEALKRGHEYLTIDDIYARLGEGEIQYWHVGKSCLITRLVTDGEHIVCRIWLGAGELNECLYLHDMVEKWAREMNCSRLEISGRDWSRVLKPRGYRRIRVTVAKDL